MQIVGFFVLACFCPSLLGCSVHLAPFLFYKSILLVAILGHGRIMHKIRMTFDEAIAVPIIGKNHSSLTKVRTSCPNKKQKKKGKQKPLS